MDGFVLPLFKFKFSGSFFLPKKNNMKHLTETL